MEWNWNHCRDLTGSGEPGRFWYQSEYCPAGEQLTLKSKLRVNTESRPGFWFYYSFHRLWYLTQFGLYTPEPSFIGLDMDRVRFVLLISDIL